MYSKTKIYSKSIYILNNMWNLQISHYLTWKCSLIDMLLWFCSLFHILGSGWGDALPSLARMDLQQQPHTLSSMGSLFMMQLWMNSNWKYPMGLINKLENKLPMDGTGDEPQQKKKWIFLKVYLEGCFRAKFGASL